MTLIENKGEKSMEENSKNEDNVTKYGEFVCTEFAWLPLDKQKEKAKKMQKITDKENNNK